MINSKNIRKKILVAYMCDKKVADDDSLLIAKIWERCGWDNSKSLVDNLRAMPNPETIRRTRQKLVSEGLIIPSEDATERRYKSFKNARRDLGYAI
jgi:hypothetical protein